MHINFQRYRQYFRFRDVLLLKKFVVKIFKGGNILVARLCHIRLVDFPDALIDNGFCYGIHAVAHIEHNFQQRNDEIGFNS